MNAANFDGLYGQVESALERKLGATVTDHQVTTVSGTKALRVEYDAKAGQTPVRGTQVYVVHNGKLLCLTTTQNDVDSSTADANTIIDSLRLT